MAIEALAAGRPMVATEVDGTPEVLIHEKTGLLAPPANPAALAAAIDRLLGDPGLASRLASQGRKFVQENFAVQRQIDQTAALYSELMGIGSIASGRIGRIGKKGEGTSRLTGTRVGGRTMLTSLFYISAFLCCTRTRCIRCC